MSVWVGLVQGSRALHAQERCRAVPAGLPGQLVLPCLHHPSLCTGQPHSRLYDEFALADRLRMRGWVLPGARLGAAGGSVAAGRGLPQEGRRRAGMPVLLA